MHDVKSGRGHLEYVDGKGKGWGATHPSGKISDRNDSLPLECAAGDRDLAVGTHVCWMKSSKDMLSPGFSAKPGSPLRNRCTW